MKKLYIVGLILMTASLAGCTPTVPEVTEGLTGDVLTGDVLTGDIGSGEENTPIISGSEMEEFTGEFDSGVVALLSGSNTVTDELSGVDNEVEDLIDDRADKPSDDSKLTEEDIDLIDQIIKKVQGLGN